MPAENGVQRAIKHGVIDRAIGPSPERTVCLTVSLQQVSCNDGRLPNAPRKALLFHAILHGQDALLKELTYLPVRALRGVWWNSAGLDSKRKVGVTRTIRR